MPSLAHRQTMMGREGPGESNSRSSGVPPHGYPTRLLCPGDPSGKSTGVGCQALLQGIFLAQGSNPHLLWLLHCKQILCHRDTGQAQIKVGLLFKN